MPIRIKRYVEPLSLRSETQSPAIIESDAYRQVCTDLEMYVNGEILGRSFLVAGHRGAGKTTMLRQAVHEVDSRIRKKGETSGQYARPLFIALHGPDLLSKPSDPPSGKPEEPPKPDEKPQPAAAADPAAPAPKPAPAPQPAQPVPKPPDPAAPLEPPPRDELRHFLDRVTSGLYVGAAQEFARRFREQALGVAKTEREKSELLELAADLQVQLDRQPDLDRLRDYWNRVDALDGGVLYKAAKQTGRGAEEVTALFSIGRVMRTFAGTLQSSLSTEDSRTRDASVSLVTIDGQSLLPPLIGLVTGAVVWGVLPEATDPLVKAFSALLTGFGTVLGFKVSASRTRSSSQTWKETYIPKDDPGSLYRVLPGLIERFQRVGLFPVFVVDELDKVAGLGEKINSLLGYMKQFVTERAFFCFVTNRSFYQQANTQAIGSAYSTLHTRFGDSVFVLYRPDDFHKYLENMFVIEGEPEAEKAQDAVAMLRYVLLSRSYLHPYDLRRELARWQDGELVNRSVEDLNNSPRLQRDVVMQVAVEVVYAGQALREHLRDPITAQTALDALYYPARKWREGENELEITQDKLTKYLVVRTGFREEATEAETTAATNVLIPPALQKTLFEQVERMMILLGNPPALIEEASQAGVRLPEAIIRVLRTFEPLVEKV